MSKSKKLFVILCAAMVCFFTGCSNSISKKNRTIVFNFGSYSNKSGSRNAIEDLAAKGLECFVDLSLQGSYKFKDTFSLNTQTSYAVEGIPVGARIKAVIEIYTFKDPADESTRLVLFSGESQTYTISESVNQITVKLNKNEEALELINGSGAQEEEDNSIKIYVSNLAKKNGNGDEWETDEDASHDGRTKDTAFDYIQSAIKWIADNGDGTSAYTIYLIDYDEAPFNQCMVFGDTTSSHDDNLRYKASSITLRSSDPDKLAICSDSHTILIATNVHVLFKNIQISCAEGKIILKTHADNNYRNYNVTLDQRTVLIGSKDKGKTSCAIYINTGTVKMDGNARIKNFLGSSSGGAVYIEDGYLNMKGNSVIEN